jgi:phage gp36-like protein
MPVTGSPISSGPASGYYADQADVEDVFGVENVARWSQLQNDVTAADTNRIQRALAGADADVDDFFRGGPYALPLPVNRTTTDWAATLAGVWLVQSRQRGADDELGWVTDLEKAVRREMAAYRARILRLGDDATRISKSPDGPSSVTV